MENIFTVAYDPINTRNLLDIVNVAKNNWN